MLAESSALCFDHAIVSVFSTPTSGVQPHIHEVCSHTYLRCALIPVSGLFIPLQSYMYNVQVMVLHLSQCVLNSEES